MLRRLYEYNEMLLLFIVLIIEQIQRNKMFCTNYKKKIIQENSGRKENEEGRISAIICKCIKGCGRLEIALWLVSYSRTVLRGTSV